MKLVTKKRIPLFIGITAVLGLAQCDLVRVTASELFFSPVIMDFPIGESAQISYPISSWIEKPYIITFKIEYPNYQKILDSQKQMEDIPYRISLKCYKLEKTKETLFFQDTYIIRDKIYHLPDNGTFTIRQNLFDGDSGWDPENPNNPEASGTNSGMGGIRLPYGKYRCDFKDESPFEIRQYLQKASIIRTAVQILPYKPFIY